MLNGTGYCCTVVYIAYCCCHSNLEAIPIAMGYDCQTKRLMQVTPGAAPIPNDRAWSGSVRFCLVLFCDCHIHTAVQLNSFRPPTAFSGLAGFPHPILKWKTRPPLPKLEHQNRGGGTQQYRELLILVLFPP